MMMVLVHSIGKYKDGKRIDEWKFYFQMEQCNKLEMVKNGLLKVNGNGILRMVKSDVDESLLMVGRRCF